MTGIRLSNSGIYLNRHCMRANDSKIRDAITNHDGDNHAVRDQRYQYIRYSDGSEELYDLLEDRNEWRNLADDESMTAIISRLSTALP